MIRKITFLVIFSIPFCWLNAQTWEPKAFLPGFGRHHPVSFSLNNKGYMLTGSTNFELATADFYEYDPILDSWRTLPDFPGSPRGFSIGDTWNGKAYMGFGVGPISNILNDLWEYDPTTGIWTELTACPCTPRYHPTFVIENGLLFVGVGSSPNGNLNDWWEYNIQTDTWRQLTDLPGPPRHHPYMFSANGDVYTGLGHGAIIFKDWYKWDIDLETWTQMDDLPAVGRVAGTQFSIGDRGFILSGDDDNHNAMQTGEFWEYDYQTDTWTEHPPHPGVSRWAPGSFAIGNVVYFGAGEIYEGNQGAGYRSDLWSFDLDMIASISDDNYLEDIVLLPNPTSSYIQIPGLPSETTIEIKIYSNVGQLVLSQNGYDGNINIEELHPGIYFLTIKDRNTHKAIKKFVKH